MIALDSNVVLRIVTHDDPRQLAAAARFMEARPGESFFVSDIVLTEVVWSLLRLYRWPRPNVLAALRSVGEKTDLEFEDRDRLLAAIRAFSEGGDFADELIVQTARSHRCAHLATFDTDLATRHPGFALRPR